MANAVYVMREKGEMVRLDPAEYEKEEMFQSLLGRFPDLLAGDQINPEQPRRWLLLTPEAAVPDNSEASSRWWLDHLFIDQDAIPTLVEVKRQSDTRLRREVVGQMIEYAANAVKYWPADSLREKFEQQCAKAGTDPEAALAQFLGEGPDGGAFWTQAGTNLEQGNVRLVFAVDRVRHELQRIVEFLNERMSPTEVLAVEIRRYVGGGLETHIPRVFGQTTAARDRKQHGTPGTRARWDEDRFFADAEKRLGAASIQPIRDMLDRCKASSGEITWGTGRDRGSFTWKFGDLCRIGPISVYTDGTLEWKLGWMSAPEQTSFRDLLHQTLREHGISIPVPPDGKSFTQPIEVWRERWEPYLEAVLEGVERYRQVTPVRRNRHSADASE